MVQQGNSNTLSLLIKLERLLEKERKKSQAS